MAKGGPLSSLHGWRSCCPGWDVQVSGHHGVTMHRGVPAARSGGDQMRAL